jgi:hypothetical protein
MDSPSRRSLVAGVDIQTLELLQPSSSALAAALREGLALVVLHMTLVRIAVLVPSSRTGIAAVDGNGTLAVVGIEAASHIELGLDRIEAVVRIAVAARIAVMGRIVVVAQEHTRIGPVRVVVRIGAVGRTCIEVVRLAVAEVVRGIEVREFR